MFGRGRHVACTHILVGKVEGRLLFTRPRPRWDDNIKMEFKEVRWEGVDWIDLTLDKGHCSGLMNTRLNFKFHNRRIIFRIVKCLLDSHEGLVCKELVKGMLFVVDIHFKCLLLFLHVVVTRDPFKRTDAAL